jgi:hypothetical protein
MADMLIFPTTTTYQVIEKNEKAVEYEKLPSIADLLGVGNHELLPENISITNHQRRQGGMIFGNIYIYGKAKELTKELEFRILELEKENEFKKRK